MEVQVDYKNGDKAYISDVVSFYHSNMLNLGSTLEIVKSSDDGKGKTTTYPLNNIDAIHVVDYKNKSNKMWI